MLGNQSHVDTEIELSRTHACRNVVEFSIIPMHIAPWKFVCLWANLYVK